MGNVVREYRFEQGEDGMNQACIVRHVSKQSAIRIIRGEGDAGESSREEFVER